MKLMIYMWRVSCSHTDILTVSEEDVGCFVSEGSMFEVVNESMD